MSRMKLEYTIDDIREVEQDAYERGRRDALEEKPLEDCISRKYMLERAQEWKNMYPDSDTAREALTMLMNEIDNAPSVVPSEAEPADNPLDDLFADSLDKLDGLGVEE